MIHDKLSGIPGKINREKILIILFFLFILSIGYVIGRVAGNRIVSGLLEGKRFVLLLYRPPFEYLNTANLLYSSDELKRLEGYYSLLDNKIIDTGLLIERYNQETGLVRPVIIWLLGYSSEKDAVLKFVSDEYANSDARLKKEILKTMKRMDEGYFKDFASSKKINIKNL